MTDQLCEHVRIGENTIDVMDWQDLAKKAAKVVAKAVRFWLNGVLSQDGAVQEGIAEACFDALHLDPEHINIVVAMELDDAGNYIYDRQASIEGDYHIVMGNYVLLEK